MIDCNALTSLPASIGGCVSLKKLWCFGSGLKSLPLELGLLPKLATIKCHGVYFEDPEMAALVDHTPWSDSPKLVAYLHQNAPVSRYFKAARA